MFLIGEQGALSLHRPSESNTGGSIHFENRVSLLKKYQTPFGKSPATCLAQASNARCHKGILLSCHKHKLLMITPSDTEEALQHLASNRALFHSEADFQHALAWTVHQRNSTISVRLELPFRADASSEYLDLLFSNGSESLAVELKYKTRRFSLQHAGESFHLKQQGAQDLGRYDFLSDVERLERFVAAKRATGGCAILLTNDQSYWAEPARVGTVDQNFRLTEGRILHGSLAWLGHASEGTIRTRERPITLNGTYKAAWRNYSNPCGIPGGEFRYLAWHVKCPP